MGMGSLVGGRSAFVTALLVAAAACSDPPPHDRPGSSTQAGSGGAANGTGGGSSAGTASSTGGGSNAGTTSSTGGGSSAGTASSTGGGSSAGTASSIGGGSSAGTASSGGPGGSTASCNDLVLDAPAWGLTYDPDPAPAPLGGQFVDGTYVVTKEIVYDATSVPNFPLARTKVVIAGTTWQQVEGEAEPDGVNPDRHATSTMSVVGTRLSLTRSCPVAGMVEGADFTVDDSGFTLYIEDLGKRIAVVLAKQ